MSMILIDERSKADAKIVELSEAYARRVEAMPPGTCPIAVQAGLLETSAAQTCGKCTPCREGIPRIKALLDKVLRYEADRSDVAEIAERARLLRDTADCAVGYDAGAQVLKGLESFADEYEC